MNKVDIRKLKPVDVLADQLGLTWPPNKEYHLAAAHALIDIAQWLQVSERVKDLPSAIDYIYQMAEGELESYNEIS